MADRDPVRRALLDAVILSGILLVLHLAVGVVWSLLGGLSIVRLGAVIVGAVAGSWPMLLAFVVVSALIALTGWPRSTRFRLAAPAAIVAWLLGQALVAVLDGRPLPDGLLWSIFGLPMFVAVAFAAGLIASPVAAAILRPAPGPTTEVPDRPAPASAPAEVSAAPAPPAAVPIVRGLALAAATLLALSLPWQWFRVYFRFPGASDPVVRAEQGWQYLATVVVALGLIVLAGVLARRLGGSIIGSVVAFAIVGVVALVCQVPAGTIWLDPGIGQVEQHEVDPHYVDCAYDASRPGCGG